MGLFNKTEEELAKKYLNDECDRLLLKLKGGNQHHNLNAEVTDLINGIKNGKENEFETFETIEKLVDFVNKLPLDSTASITLADIRLMYSDLVEKDNDESRKKFENYVFGNPYDNCLYAINNHNLRTYFENVDNYYQVFETYRKSDIDDSILERFCSSISTIVPSEETFKNELISFINGYNVKFGAFQDCESPEKTDLLLEYLDNEINRVYSEYGCSNHISERELELFKKKFKEANTILEKMKEQNNRFEEYSTLISNELQDALKVINTASKESCEKLDIKLNSKLGSIDSRIESLIASLQDKINNCADIAVKQILTEYEEKLNDMRKSFVDYDKEATANLLRLKNEVDNGIKDIKEYASSDEVKEAIQLSRDGKGILAKVESLDGINFDEIASKVNIMVPSKEVVTTEKKIVEPKKVLTPEEQRELEARNKRKEYLLDLNQSFDKRSKMIEEAMNEGVDKGIKYHAKVLEVCKCILNGEFPYLYGPSGTGKTHLVKQVADLFGMDMVESGSIREQYNIYGYSNIDGIYLPSTTYTAVDNGSLLFLDEFDNNNQNLCVLFNTIYSALEEKLEDVDKEIIISEFVHAKLAVNKNFRMIAAGNTKGEGSNTAYSSRSKIDESLQERFSPIEVPFDEELERKILADYEDWYKFCMEFRKACNAYAKQQGNDEVIGGFTTRDAKMISRFLENGSKSLSELLEQRFIQTKDKNYLTFLKDRLCKGSDISQSDLESPAKKIKLNKIQNGFAYLADKKNNN